MSGAPNLPPPRWGPLRPQNWPQDVNRVPSATGQPMPTVSEANKQRSVRESFTISGTWTVAFGNAVGQEYPLYLPTPPDGDFWCDQMYVASWFSSVNVMARCPPALVSIADARTSRSLTYPKNVNINFLTTLLLFSEDAGFDPGGSPYPDGFRSTTTMPQPFCFTRAGGISLVLTMLPATVGPDNLTVDIAFGGWKEFRSAST